MITWPCIRCGSTDRYNDGKCKPCRKQCAKAYAEKNPEKVADRKHQYALRNADRIAEYQKQYREENREIQSERRKVYYQENKTSLLENKKAYYEKNRDKVLQRSIEYGKANRKKIGAYLQQYSKNRRAKDPVFALCLSIRCRVGQAVTKQHASDSTAQIIGCSWQQLKEHIEAQFRPGMSWENRGRYGWHIDHKIPLASAKSEKEIRKLCHYTNLQPLWWRENLSKNSRHQGAMIRKQNKQQQ